MHFMTPSIPYTIPMITPQTIQTSSSLVDSLLVSYIVLLIFNGFKSCLFFSGWLYMTLVIIGLILHLFGPILNTYGSDLKSIHHSDSYAHQFSPVAHTFPSLAPYPHGVTEAFVYVLINYGSYLKSIHHSQFFTRQFSPVVHIFPSLAPYPHGNTKYFVFSIPCANNSDISYFFSLTSYLVRCYIRLEE